MVDMTRPASDAAPSANDDTARVSRTSRGQIVETARLDPPSSQKILGYSTQADSNRGNFGGKMVRLQIETLRKSGK
jgi:hypothetical protein